MLKKARRSQRRPLPITKYGDARVVIKGKNPVSPVAAAAVIAACNAAAIGFELCAQRTRDEAIAVATQREAESLRLAAEKIIATAAARGVDARPRRRTCERLRWEWLASTGMVLDGRSDARLLSECARILEELPDEERAIDRDVAARLRVATMTAVSLMALVDRDLQPAFAT